MKKILVSLLFLVAAVASFAQIDSINYPARKMPFGNWDFIWTNGTLTDTVKVYPEKGGIGLDTLFFGDSKQWTAWTPGVSDTSFVNTMGDSLYGTYYWPGSDNSYIRGGALYFVNNTDFLQAIPTQIKISSSTHDYATLNSYRLHLNKAASTSIDIDTNGIILNNTDFSVRDEQGFEYLRHNYGDSTTTISNLTVSSAAADTAVVINGNLKADTIFAITELPYKVYVALLNQTDTNAPVATVLKNTLGGNPVFSRIDVGLYRIDLADAFSLNKTIIFIGSSHWDGRQGYFCINDDDDDDYLLLQTLNITGDPADNMLKKTSLEIRVYP